MPQLLVTRFMLNAIGPTGRVITAIGIALAVLFAAPAADAKRPPKAHIVIDAASGQEILSSAPDMQIHPASLTKMMTLHLLFDELAAGRLKLHSRIRFSRYAASRPPSKLGVPAGSSISVETAILALTVKSGNDVAVAVAEHIGGSVKNFAVRMNAKARSLGMARTNFVNPSGLHHRRQISTPRDMAQLARALRYGHRAYYKFFEARSFKYAGRTYRTHNRFVKSYQGADGLKTGYINASGFNLAGSAVRSDRRLIGIVIGGRTSRARDDLLKQLMDRGFRAARTLSEPRYAGIFPVAVSFNTGKAALPPRRPGVADPATMAVLVAAATSGARQTPVPAVRPAAQTTTVAVAAIPQRMAGASASVGRGGYALQVGAVTSSRAARSLATTRLRTLGAAVSGGAPAVAELRLKSGRRLYRARISNLTGPQAERACEALQKSGEDCLVVATSSNRG